MATQTLKALTPEQQEAFERDGFLVVRDFLTREEIAEVRDGFMAQNADGPVPGLSEINPNYRADDPLSFYPRMMHPHNHPELAVGPLAMRLMLAPRLKSVLEDLFGEEPIAAQSMFYFKPPKARGQELHQDNYYLRVAPGTCLAAWLAVDDADEENGGMKVVPGSHRLDIACPERADLTTSFTGDYVAVPQGMEAVPVTLRAGDMLFFNGSLIHGSYPNASATRFRRALIFHYVPRSTAEMSAGYDSKFTFDGVPYDAIAPATGGGPCGIAEGMPAVLH